MPDRKKLSHAVKSIAWGYVLVHLHFNLGTLDLLPDWLGILLILKALPTLSQFSESVGLLRPFAILLALWEGIDWILAALGIAPELAILSVIGTIISLYFRFQLMTEVAQAAEYCHCPQQNKLLLLRNVDAVSLTLFTVPIPWGEYEILSFLMILVAVFITCWICKVLFSLARSLGELPAPSDEPEIH